MPILEVPPPPPALATATEEAGIIEEVVKRSNKERAHLVRSQATTKMEALSYEFEIIEAFSLAFGELVNNAFEHGCVGSDCQITIQIEVTRQYVVLIIVNSRGIKFDVIEAYNKAKAKLHSNRSERRGRGLITVYQYADTVESLPNKNGVKATFYFQRVILNVQTVDTIRIIEILQGHRNPSINRRLVEQATNMPADSLIVHLPRAHGTETECVNRFETTFFGI